ncbi:MAG: hypothetical protein PHX83_03155 [Acidobacteriia bacterium]|nr:hypothetical protein [Terriglobia bacterium]
MGNENAAETFAMSQASGTSTNPSSAPMEMYGFTFKSWNLMLHGQGFLADIQQTGPRGDDKLFSVNWLMGMASHPWGGGQILFRSMLSFDPATITERRYPLLFQTGETAFGQTLVDAQHPHDFFMELAMEYVRSLGEKNLVYFYFAPVGDPALGPAAFPHRVSAAELPQATLSHHLQDSTHVANEVVTVGFQRGIVRWEASGFHGGEPDENRWDIDHGSVDSWATRLTLTPSANWVGQVSIGRLNKPEALENGDVIRSTASISYNRNTKDGYWASSIVWGRNHKTADHRDLNSYLLESVFHFQEKNYLTGRIELVDKEDLLPSIVKTSPFSAPGPVFRIGAFTVGYTRDVPFLPGIQTGLGANFTFYSVPDTLKTSYGDRPMGVIFFARFRLLGNGMMHHESMP